MPLEEWIKALRDKTLLEQFKFVDSFFSSQKGGVTLEDIVTIYQATDFNFDEATDHDEYAARARRYQYTSRILEVFFEENIANVDSKNLFKLLRYSYRRDVQEDEEYIFKLCAVLGYIRRKPDVNLKEVTQIVKILVDEVQGEAAIIAPQCLSCYFINHEIKPEEIAELLSQNKEDNLFIVDNLLRALPFVSAEIFATIRDNYALGAGAFTAHILRNIAEINLDQDFYIYLLQQFKSMNPSAMKSGFDECSQEASELIKFADIDFFQSLKSFVDTEKPSIYGIAPHNQIIEVSWFLANVLPCFAPRNFAIGAAEYKAAIIITFLNSSKMGKTNAKELTDLLRQCAVADLENPISKIIHSHIVKKTIDGKVAGEMLQALYPGWEERKKAAECLLDVVLQDESCSNEVKKERVVKIISASIDSDDLQDFLTEFTKAGARNIHRREVRQYFDSSVEVQPSDEAPKKDVRLPEADGLKLKVNHGQIAQS